MNVAAHKDADGDRLNLPAQMRVQPLPLPRARKALGRGGPSTAAGIGAVQPAGVACGAFQSRHPGHTVVRLARVAVDAEREFLLVASPDVVEVVEVLRITLTARILDGAERAWFGRVLE